MGGAERQSILLARELRERWQADIFFLLFGKRRGLAMEALESFHIPYQITRYADLHSWWRFPFALCFLSLFAWRLRKLRPEILMPYCEGPDLWTGLIRRFVPGVKAAIWNQRNDGHHIPLKRVRPALDAYDCFVSNSRAGAHYLVDELKIPEQKIRIIPNGIEEVAPELSRSAWRKRFGFSETDILTCMVANLHRNKDHETLIKAWKIVMDRIPGKDKCHLLLAGLPGNAYAQIRERVRQLALSGNIHFLGQVKDVPSLLRAVDLSVLSTRGEGLPNAVLESMAFGLPVATTDIPGCREALGEEMDYCLSPPGDEQAMAKNLCSLIGSLELREKTGIMNKKRLEDNFSVARLCHRTSELLTAILAGGRDGQL